MKLDIKIIYIFLFLIPQISFGGGIEKYNCKNSEISISLADYSYCIPKGGLESFRVLGGKHATVYVIDSGVEYSFSRIPTSIVVLDIPKRTGLSISQFFERLLDFNYTENNYTDIRSAFDIKKNTIVSNYANKRINAYYIINESSINNSIYLLNDSEAYIYTIRGNFDESFAIKLLSNMKYFL